MMGRLATLALLASITAAAAAPACPAGNADFPPFSHDPALYESAIAKVAGFEPANERLTGIVTPHHLLADRLVALGFRAASAFTYKRIVILSPDHFRQTNRMFATSARGYQTEFGAVPADTAAISQLIARRPDLIEESCLFATEHGVRALLPFVRRYFPDAEIVPIAMSVKSRRADWDALLAAILPLVTDDTLVVESTDFSHYLPQPVARRFDQQTLNVLAAGDLDQIAALTQPDHADSVGALYIQTALQRRRFGAQPVVVANDTSNSFAQKPMDSTTSYNVVLFGDFDAAFNSPVLAGTDIYYFAGDTNFGRAMKMALLDPDAADEVRRTILTVTRGRPMIVNLEGVILPDVPSSLDGLTLAMPEDITLRWLKDLNVVAVSLANNHANDLGASGMAETTRALDAAGIAHFAQGGVLELPRLYVVGLTDLDSNGLRQTQLIGDELLGRLARPDAGKAVLAMAHWGREYESEPSPREIGLADRMRLAGAAAIIGGHPHVASASIVALAGGDTAAVYSVGNFLFDQTAARSSGQIVEVRVFPQGTVFVRTLPLPNLFDLARRHQQPPGSSGR